MRSLVYSLLFCSFCLINLRSAGAAEHREAAEPKTELKVVAPLPWSVFQRRGFVPGHAHQHQPGGPASGFADIEIVLSELPEDGRHLVDYRVRPLNIPVQQPEPGFSKLVFSRDSTTQQWKSQVRIAAGGWYAIDLRIFQNDQILSAATVEPIGVGEVLFVAGQSYATNCNDQQFQVMDSGRRVSAFNWRTGNWQLANDPQPCADESNGGSIWPLVGDQLASILNVPIGFVNVAYGGTSSEQWMPDGDLHRRLMATAQLIPRARAVLWQQGESDVIAGATTDDYVGRIRTIRDHAAAAWKQPVPWLLAKSTLHPTVYQKPVEEQRIRDGIERLIQQHGFLRGPDTDILAGENRGGPETRRHFSAVGQQNAASMWCAAILQHITTPVPEDDRIMELLADFRLNDSPWSSKQIWRESSILMTSSPAGDSSTEPDPTANPSAIARLAYPASEIVEVRSADGTHQYQQDRDFVVSPDGTRLLFSHHHPIKALSDSELFPPKDSPNSYRHRTTNPEQNLLYAPGRWFHDHNIEVTYVRADVSSEHLVPNPVTLTGGDLKRTKALLTSGRKLRLGISGDSISTGLDASGLTYAWPCQPGYPDLLAAQLQAQFNSTVEVTNRAVAGWSVANGVQDLDALLQSEPHLVVVAYGMNDVGRRDPKWFREQTATIIHNIQERLPHAEIILVSPMLGNSEWVHTPREMFSLYRDELKSLCGPGIMLADVTEVWTKMLHNKHDLDLTGNGLNHPNDFGHRLYAMTILSLLTQPEND